MKALSKKQVYTIWVVLGVLAFIILAQWSQQYSEPLTQLATQAGWIGVFSYIVIMAASIIIAPLGTGFLLPVGANSYGPFLTAVYSIVGWTGGSLVAFWIARRFGSQASRYQTFIQRIQYYEKTMSRKRFYTIIVLFRMALPVDVISYALGFASTIKYSAFFATTLIGITPLTFMFTYAAISTLKIQILVGVITTLIFLIGMYFVYKEYRSQISSLSNS